MAELPTINLALYAQTDVGMVRSGNEDNFLILDLSTGRSWTASEEEPSDLLTYSQGYYGSLMAVSDGMGGALAGEVASRMAVETVRDRMLQLQAHEVYSRVPFHERLRLAIEEANILINGESQTVPAHKGLGATFTAVGTLGADVFFGQVGDSRAHLIRKGKIVRATKDQSLVQQLIDAGQITEEEAETHSYRNVILQALGAHSSVNVEVSRLDLRNMDTLVICSDGLSGKVHQDEIAQIVHESEDFKLACQRLINLANERGGEDNITVVIAQFSGSGLAAPESEDMEPQSLARSPDTPTEINWGGGAETDQSDGPTAPIADPSDLADAPTTEPLPIPAAQTAAIESKAAPATTDLSHTTDPLPARGPITAVFTPEDLNDDPNVSPLPPAKTAPFESPHDARPVHPQNSTAVPSQNPPVSPVSPVSMAASKTGEPALRAKGAKPAPSASGDGRSRRNVFIFTLLIALVIGGLAVGVNIYVKQQAQAQATRQQAQMKSEIQSQKEGQIGSLREKIAELSKRLEASNKPSVEKKRDISEKLTKLSQRLDEINKMSPDQSSEISQGCDDIGKELNKIEEEVNSMHGLLPPLDTDRDPIKV
ncbi:MAG: protein phosphatase 2C domain-containing protein [Blastocatellia bacterium]|nr:protein phosphatase 2C domain-containing protein [Blastocatellia bacterium]